jgi:hypothetical protein
MRGRQWLVLMISLAIALLVGSIGVARGPFVDLESSGGNSFQAWTSILWVQTTEDDFNAGVLNDVNTSSKPGDVRVASVSGWYSTAWKYRKSHIIQSASGAGANYQVRIIVYQGSGTDTDENVYLSAHCEDDFGDIRFTDSDGTTELDYWMESYTEGDKATFWVKVTHDLSSSNATVYVYYGNSEAPTTSNGANTFPDLFTDFPGDSLPSGWEVDGDTVGSMVIENSLLKLTARKEASGSWLKRGVRTSSGVWTNDRALMYRIDSINYYPEVTDRRRWFLGGEGYNSYLEFQSWGDKTRVRDWGLYDEYSPCDFTDGDVVWLAKESGNDGVAYFYVDGNLVDILDYGLDPGHAFFDFTVVFNVQVGSNAMPDVDYTYIDWAAIRKFVYPEPVNASWGSEEGQYLSLGTVASQVLDNGVVGAGWDGLFWDETIDGNTNVTFEVRASDTLFAKDDVTPDWIDLGLANSPITSGLPSGRYMQWRATLTTSDSSETPELHEVRVYHY